MSFELYLPLILFFILFVALYVVSRYTIQRLYLLLHHLFRQDWLATGIISFIFFPGTLIHELSHFGMAFLLLLPIHSLSFWPKRIGQGIRLGYVTYEKKDKIRGILVGIAPIFTGIVLFWWLYTINFFTPGPWQIQLFKVYIMFTLSSTMFSSRQDLIDIGFLVPILLLSGLIVYIFDIPLLFFLNYASVVEALTNFLYSVSIYTGISIVVHLSIIVICSIIIRLLPIHSA